MDYNFQTTFWNDFTIAEMYGIEEIRDTYDRIFEEWYKNAVFMTELTIVLNWKIWDWYNKNETIAKVYNELWMQQDKWCITNLTGDDLKYFYKETD